MWLCVYVCVCSHMCLCMCVCMHGDLKSTLSVFLYHSPPYCLKPALPLSEALINSRRLIIPQITVISYLSIRTKDSDHHNWTSV